MSDKTQAEICDADCNSGCHSDSCDHHGFLAAHPTPPPPLDVEALTDAVAEALPVPTMLDVDFAENTARAILAALEGSTDDGQ